MILLDIATYLASITNKQLGVNVFSEAIPPNPDLVIVVREPRDGGYVHPQLECDVRKIQIVVRDRVASNALNIAEQCHKALVYQGADMTKAADGLIQFTPETFGSVELQGNPRYDEIDDKGRRQYKFNANIITQRKY